MCHTGAWIAPCNIVATYLSSCLNLGFQVARENPSFGCKLIFSCVSLIIFQFQGHLLCVCPGLHCFVLAYDLDHPTVSLLLVWHPASRVDVGYSLVAVSLRSLAAQKTGQVAPLQDIGCTEMFEYLQESKGRIGSVLNDVTL